MSDSGKTPPGQPAYCSVCEAPIVVYESRTHGYRLVCACEGYSVNLTDAVANESLFTPMTGQWSNIDTVEPWGDSEIGFDAE